MYRSFSLALSGKTASAAQLQQLLEERIRAIEQVKRIYAVIMGYAATQLIANQYTIVQIDGFEWRIDGGFAVSQAICFTSLITLFYLGAERMLEARYLRPNSGDATRVGLLFDVLILGVQGLMFMILANTIPTLPEFVKLGHAGAQQLNQMRFVTVLLWLYAIDTVALAVQCIRFTGGIEREAAQAHGLWFTLNVVTFAALWIASLWPSHDFPLAGLAINCLSATVFIAHIVRFWADYANTFQFYYPHLDP